MQNLDTVSTSAPPLPVYSPDELVAERFRWTTDKYYRAGDAGVFDGRHVELIHGDILVKPDHEGVDGYDNSDERPRFEWTSDLYNRVAEAGVFEGKRVELIEGEILEMAPMGPRHFVTINIVAEVLTSVFGKGFFVSSQNQLDVDDHSQPEPDIAVLAGVPRDYLGGHPRTLVLAVEVSDSSLVRDRGAKARLYAKAGIQDYWIVNLVDHCVEVYRHPVNDPEHGFAYSERTVYSEDDVLTPLAKSDSSIKVADILP